MPLVSWSDEFSVGVKSLDSQHINLFSILNDLHESMKSGKDQSAAGPLLYKLLDYTREHFAAEEKLMEAAHYPELAQHRLQHIALTTKVVNLVTRLDEGGCALNVDLLFFLRDWLQTHILRQDKAYGPWITGQGVPSALAGQRV